MADVVHIFKLRLLRLVDVLWLRRTIENHKNPHKERKYGNSICAACHAACRLPHTRVLII
ncbi:hypothetical protein NQ317_008051 [Molorchus minor]|uniref:Uncharacterized protein n=1 Tax=Molorchus minor TaxID=1323400 RepID=A0ABQ9IT38_9CUCU|nr:hypothetical protein NQ317_008051 [Molorchus minor]